MRDQLVDLFEGAFVEEQFDALAGGELALVVLAVAALVAATLLGGGVAAAELLESVHANDCSWASDARRGWLVGPGGYPGWWLVVVPNCAGLWMRCDGREGSFWNEQSQ